MSQATPSQLAPLRVKTVSSTLVEPGLPQWLLSIPGVPKVVERLGVTEFRRRLFHMSPALIPVGLPFIPHPDVWGPILTGAILVFTAAASIFAMTHAHLVKREGETEWRQAVLGYMATIVTPLLFFPGRAELGLMTLQIVALGDGSATLGGLMFGGRKLPWNPRKTVSGILSFILVGTLASTYSYWGEASPSVPILTVLAICSTAALAAAIVESLPIRSNDNFRVGSTALAVGIVMSAILT